MKCHNCNGTEFEQRTVDLATRVGEYTVLDGSMTRPVCANCGEFTLSASALEKVELRAAVVAFTDAPRVTGSMVRFARKALGMTQSELAQRIGTSPESVSRWEREERPMEVWVPIAVIGLVRERIMPTLPNVHLQKAS